MSDMDQNDIVEPVPAPEVAPAAEPVAPEAVAVEAPAVEAVEVPAPAVEAVPVVASVGSNQAQPDAAPEAVKEPLSIEDAARVLLVYVKAHRTAGDADLEAAVADLEASIDAQA